MLRTGTPTAEQQSSAAAQRLLLVHAHPDDEVIGTGGTMARYLDEGHSVTLVTCTAGEMGEVLVPELTHLAHDQEDRLGEHRRGEIANALAALESGSGQTIDHRWLGGFGTYRDSGMAWHEDGHAIADEAAARDNSFWYADLTEAANHLVTVIREVRPQVLVSYDQFGGYGHPDHIQAHRVAMYASTLAAVPSYREDLGAAWDVPKIYWTAMNADRIARHIRMAKERGIQTPFDDVDFDKPNPFSVPGRLLSTEVDAGPWWQHKVAALREYPTQVAQDGPFLSIPDNAGAEAFAIESFRIVKGVPVPGPDGGLETDLFAQL